MPIHYFKLGKENDDSIHACIPYPNTWVIPSIYSKDSSNCHCLGGLKDNNKWKRIKYYCFILIIWKEYNNRKLFTLGCIPYPKILIISVTKVCRVSICHSAISAALRLTLNQTLKKNRRFESDMKWKIDVPDNPHSQGSLLR